MRSALLAAVLLAAVPAGAEEPAKPQEPVKAEEPVKLDPVVVKSLGQPGADAPTETRVILPAEIERRTSLDAVEALRAEPGVSVQRETGLGDTVSLSIRGSAENQILILQDGVPINDWSFGGGGVLSGFDPEGFGRMEVVRGPFSPLSASAAMGGVVRLETVRNNGQERVLGRLDAGAPYGASLLGAGLGGRVAGLALTGGSREYGGLAGYASFTQAGSTLALSEPGRLDLPANRFDRGSGAVSWETPAAGGTLLAVGRIEASRTRLGVGAIDGVGTYYDGNRALNQQLLLASLRWNAAHTDTYAWSLRAGFARTTSTDNDPVSLGQGVFAPGDDGKLHLNGTSGRIDRVSPVGLVGTDHAASLGMAGTLLFGAEMQVLDPSVRGALAAYLDNQFQGSLPLSGSQTRVVVGAYAADRAQLGPFEALLGVRVDHVQRSRATATSATGISSYPAKSNDSLDPRGTLAYRIAGTGTRFTVSAGTGYRAPAFTELYALPFSNPALKPERAVSGELGVTQSFGTMGSASAAAFTTRFRDLIAIDPVAFQFANIDRATFNGAEMAALITPGPLRLGATVSYVRALDGTGHPIPDVSEVTGDVRAGVTVGGMDADLFWYAWTDRLATQIYIDVSGAAVDRIPAGNRIDLSASYWFTQEAPTTRLLLRIEDLLDRRLPESVGFPAPGRSIWMGFEMATR